MLGITVSNISLSLWSVLDKEEGTGDERGPVMLVDSIISATSGYGGGRSAVVRLSYPSVVVNP